ncbi:hypothetical protein CBZ_30800 [Cellulomonas biazotea]|uniref:Uncharacterized protein n=1 Tax=Cellulomonas biazotea TaxID=1709 RepID=A0A402DV74_9CELL|nr:hypothetical protein CBZ_30800 [Cellulomonas biazotea]
MSGRRKSYGSGSAVRSRRTGCGAWGVTTTPIGGRAGVVSQTPDFIPSVASCDGLRGGAGALRGALGRRLLPAYCVT